MWTRKKRRKNVVDLEARLGGDAAEAASEVGGILVIAAAPWKSRCMLLISSGQ